MRTISDRETSSYCTCLMYFVYQTPLLHNETKNLYFFKRNVSVLKVEVGETYRQLLKTKLKMDTYFTRLERKKNLNVEMTLSCTSYFFGKAIGVICKSTVYLQVECVYSYVYDVCM